MTERKTLLAIVKEAEFCGNHAGPTALRQAMENIREIARKAITEPPSSAQISDDHLTSMAWEMCVPLDVLSLNKNEDGSPDISGPWRLGLDQAKGLLKRALAKAPPSPTAENIGLSSPIPDRDAEWKLLGIDRRKPPSSTAAPRDLAEQIRLAERIAKGCKPNATAKEIAMYAIEIIGTLPSATERTALEQIAELNGDTENQQFKLTRFQAAQIARAVLRSAPPETKSTGE
jgi:hypothetical protein